MAYLVFKKILEAVAYIKKPDFSKNVDVGLFLDSQKVWQRQCVPHWAAGRDESRCVLTAGCDLCLAMDAALFGVSLE